MDKLLALVLFLFLLMGKNDFIRCGINLGIPKFNNAKLGSVLTLLLSPES